MKIALLLVVSCMVALGTSGCDRMMGKYDVVEADGRTFLLNRSSGETAVIDGTELVRLKAPASNNANASPRVAKSWPDKSIPPLPGVKFKVRTKYRDGHMLWMASAEPFLGPLKEAYEKVYSSGATQPTVRLELHDSDGFETGESIELRLRGGTRSVDDKGEVAALSWTGRQEMSREIYEDVASIAASWVGIGDD